MNEKQRWRGTLALARVAAACWFAMVALAGVENLLHPSDSAPLDTAGVAVVGLMAVMSFALGGVMCDWVIETYERSGQA